ncbi:Uncharacterised protein [Mycobacteroides abscessus subsp. abscessus]|nr:Uncharacterised protein [Mycobacteroides abscessus subsp. abscessus]
MLDAINSATGEYAVGGCRVDIKCTCFTQGFVRVHDAIAGID